MARSNTAVDVFSDVDDVSLAASVESEPRDTYPVDCILAENVWVESDEDGNELHVKRYLVKWEGYDVLRSTWEPESSFVDDRTLFLWDAQKLQITRGHAKPFDVNAWHDEIERMERARNIRHGKRRAKRRRLGLPVSADRTASPELPMPGTSAILQSSTLENPYADDIPLAQTRSTTEQPAHIARVPRQLSSDDASDDDIPMVRKRQKTLTHAATEAQGEKMVSDGTSRKAATTDRTAPNLLKTQKLSIQSGGSLKTQRNMKASVAQNSNMATVAPSRVSKPGIDSRFVLGAGIMSNWDKPKERKTKLPTATTTDKRQITTLSALNRYQRAGRKEPAPEAATLKLINPATGDTISSTLPASRYWAPERLIPVDSLFIPDEATHDVAQKGVHVALTSGEAQVNGSHVAQTPLLVGSTSASEAGAPLQTNLVSTTETCWFHMNGGCSYGASCYWPHDDTGKMASAYNRRDVVEATCYFWATARDGCYKSEKDCLWKHRPTLYVADIKGRKTPFNQFFTDRGCQPPIAHVQGHVHEPEEQSKKTGIKKIATCLHWLLRGSCYKSADECLGAHRVTNFFLQPGQGMVPTRDWNGPVTCRLWHYKSCPFESAQDCKYLHERTRLISGLDNGPPEPHPEDVDMTSETGLPGPVNEPSNSPSPPPRSPRRDEIQSSVLTFRIPHVTTIEPQDSMKLGSGMTSSDQSLVATLSLHTNNSSPSQLNVKMKPRTQQGIHNLKRLFGSTKHLYLDVEFSCLSYGLKNHLTFDNSDVSGDVYHIVGSESSSIHNSFLNTLRMHAAIAVCLTQHFVMLLYPPGDEWHHLRSLSPHRSDATFHFLILVNPTLISMLHNQPKIAMPVHPSLQLKHIKSQGDAKVMSAHDLKRLFADVNGKVHDKTVFLVFHPRHMASALDITKQLLSHDVKVWHSITPGSWQSFANQQVTGAIVFLFDYLPFHRIPKLMHKADTSCNCFQLTFTDSASLLPLTPPPDNVQHLNTSLTRLFPYGKVVFIMDDIFENHPTEVARVIQHIVKKSTRDGKLSYKIIGRPKLERWISEFVASNHRAGRTISKSDRTLLDLRTTIHEYIVADPFDEFSTASNASPASLFYWLPFELGEDYSRDASLVANLFVKFFANWSITFAKDYRKFSVLTMTDERTRDQWEETFMHLDFVTPSAWLSREERSDFKRKLKSEHRAERPPQAAMAEKVP